MDNIIAVRDIMLYMPASKETPYACIKYILVDLFYCILQQYHVILHRALYISGRNHVICLCKRDYRIVFSIMTVSVSDTPSILRISSIHLLMSAIAGAAMIAAISYWPVIS